MIIVAFLALISATALLYGACSIKTESMVPLRKDPNTNQIVYGYYQVDASNMETIPYGFIVNPKDPTKIIPKTNTAKESLNEKPDKIPPFPATGKIMPEGFYKISDASLAVLPPNMMPAINRIDFKGDVPPVIWYYYDNGYISQQMYYAKQFKGPYTKAPASLPTEMYYVDASKSILSFLPYGQIADASNGYGMIPNPKLNLKTTTFNFATSNYRDISNNYDTQFHDSVDDIRKQNDMYDLSFGQMRVLDQNGNMIILPAAGAQSSVTYYHPGEYPFNASKYVPNYEDSVYLSNVGNRTAFGKNDDDAYQQKKTTCSAYAKMKAKMDDYCGGLGSN